MSYRTLMLVVILLFPLINSEASQRDRGSVHSLRDQYGHHDQAAQERMRVIIREEDLDHVEVIANFDLPSPKEKELDAREISRRQEALNELRLRIQNLLGKELLHERPGGRNKPRSIYFVTPLGLDILFTIPEINRISVDRRQREPIICQCGRSRGIACNANAAQRFAS